MENAFELDTVLDIEKWEKLQDKIASATHLAILLVDYRGVPVTCHSQVKPFCHLARTDPQMSKYCEKCDARGGLEAARTYRPFIYRCHFDIIDMAIPITIEGRYVGAIMAGEIMLNHDQDDLEQVLDLKNLPEVATFKSDHYQLLENYPQVSLNDLKLTADMLEELSEYIVSEAIKKDYLAMSYNKTLRFSKKSAGNQQDSEQHDPLFLNDTLRYSLLKKRLQDSGIYLAENKLLQPAIDAIFTNKDQHLDLQTLAKLVNVSPNYLSRLLRKEFGEPFSQIYAKLKIYWAQELLLTTDLSVNAISDTLGFLEPSYFIRSFKKVAHLTPLKWRQQKKD